MKKIGLLALALVMALGTMGVAFAHWSQTLTITENVTTGNFCMEFGPAGTSMSDEDAPPEVFPTTTPDENAYWDDVNEVWVTFTPTPEKNVAWGESYYTDYVDGHATGLQIKLHDVYPWYYNSCDFSLHNCGTIPAWLPKIIVKDSDGDVLGELTYDAEELDIDLDGNGTDDLAIVYGNHIGSAFQYNPCNQIDISVFFVVLQDNEMAQGEEFSFTFELPFVQFNYTPP